MSTDDDLDGDEGHGLTGDDETVDLDEVQPVSSELRPVQEQKGETPFFESGAEGHGETVAYDEDVDGGESSKLDELAPVSSSLRPLQERGREDEDADDGGGDGGDGDD